MILSEKHQMMRKLYRQFAETEFTDEVLDRLEETGESTGTCTRRCLSMASWA
jgi:hypothetical protein